MESYPNDPTSVRPPQSAPAWAGQPSPMGSPQSAPAWAGQPSPMGSPQAAPAWVENSGTLAAPTINRRSEWPALRFIARWLKIVAWVELVIGVISALAIGGSAIGNGGGLVGFVTILAFLVVSAVVFMMTYASAEGILVFLAIEKNTRKEE